MTELLAEYGPPLKELFQYVKYVFLNHPSAWAPVAGLLGFVAGKTITEERIAIHRARQQEAAKRERYRRALCGEDK